jgi:hypothetical protein
MTESGIASHRISPIDAVWYPDASAVNAPLVAAFRCLDETHFQRRTHFIAGRFENLYLRRDSLPGLGEILDFAQAQAARRLGKSVAELRSGFWLNAMSPGQSTSRHSHEENDEVLSGVYYVTAQADSGDILFHDPPFETRVTPQAGLLLLFAPELAHSVEPNTSDQLRLSIAFNFGWPD